MEYGFVYIWYDRKHKRFYIGCHWGHEDDGYICSSSWMKRAYKRRPQDFRGPRILKRIYTSREDLLLEEHRWLSMIKPEELKIKYYNLRNHHFGHWSSQNKYLTVAQKISKANKGRVHSEEEIKRRSKSLRVAFQKQREEGIGKFSSEHKNKCSERMKEYYKLNGVSEETRKKHRENAKKQSNNRGRFTIGHQCYGRFVS